MSDSVEPGTCHIQGKDMRHNLASIVAPGERATLACHGSYSTHSSQDQDVGYASPLPDRAALPLQASCLPHPCSAPPQVPARPSQRLAQPASSRCAPAGGAPRAATMPHPAWQRCPAQRRQPPPHARPRAPGHAVLLGCMLTLLPRIRGASALPNASVLAGANGAPALTAPPLFATCTPSSVWTSTAASTCAASSWSSSSCSCSPAALWSCYADGVDPAPPWG